MQCEEDWLVMHVLRDKHGWPIAKIAEEFGVSWRAARRYAASTEAPTYGPRACPARPTEAQLAHMRRRLEVQPDLRATTLLRELRELGYQGSYPTLVRVVRQLRPATEDEPVLRFETGPGVQVQGDWADCGRWLVGDRLVELYAWVAVLGFSRMVAVRFATDKTRATTLRLLVDTLGDLGGCPQEFLSDRDSALVIGSPRGGRAVFAPEWIDLAHALGVTARACRPYRAQTKGKVERVIRELKEDFLRWLTGQVLPARPALHDYDAFFHRWCAEVVATRRHRTTGRVVGEAWAEELGLLRAIPERIRALVAGDGAPAAGNVVSLTVLRRAGERVEERSLADYEEAWS